jgi:drug/metabolite transporter (DMT)-like permease
LVSPEGQPAALRAAPRRVPQKRWSSRRGRGTLGRTTITRVAGIAISITPPSAAGAAATTGGPRVGRAVAGAVAAVVLWAGYYLLARFGLTRTLTVEDLVAARYVVPAVLLLPVGWRLGVSRRGIGGLSWGRAALLTATGGLQFGLFVTAGLQFAPPAQATMFTSAGVPLFVVMLAWPFLREVPSIGQVFGVGLILAGDALVVSRGLSEGAGEFKGQLMFVLAGLGWAIYTLLVRRWHVSGVLATVVISVGSGAVFLPYYLLFGASHLSGAPAAEVVFQFVYMGALVGIGATLAYTVAVKVIGAQRAALTTALVPACATLLAIPLLGEIPTMAEALGVAAVTAGMPFALGWRPWRREA